MVEVHVDRQAWEDAGKAQRKKLRALADRLKAEPFLGDKIRRDLIPDRFSHLPNLFRLQLLEGWRALYTVATHPTGGREVRIVWIGDHTAYDRLFGYG